MSALITMERPPDGLKHQDQVMSTVVGRQYPTSWAGRVSWGPGLVEIALLAEVGHRKMGLAVRCLDETAGRYRWVGIGFVTKTFEEGGPSMFVGWSMPCRWRMDGRMSILPAGVERVSPALKRFRPWSTHSAARTDLGRHGSRSQPDRCIVGGASLSPKRSRCRCFASSGRYPALMGCGADLVDS